MAEPDLHHGVRDRITFRLVKPLASQGLSSNGIESNVGLIRQTVRPATKGRGMGSKHGCSDHID